MIAREDVRDGALTLWRCALLALIAPVALALFALLAVGWGVEKAFQVLFSRLG